MKLLLAKGGRTGYHIVVGKDAPDADKFAARELANFLFEITGAAFTFSFERGSAEKIIAVGQAAAAEAGFALEADLGLETLVHDTNGGDVALYGGQPRGTLYAMYDFLDGLGCRWFTPTVSRIPRLPDLEIFVQKKRFTPVLEYRDHNYHFMREDPVFAARNKINGAMTRLMPEMGGRIKYGPFVHTFEKLMSPKDYFEEHPEYFSMVKGERISEKTQLCLTNPDVHKIVCGEIRKWLTEDPTLTIISVSQNDWSNPCECPECKKVDELTGSNAGTMIMFLNKVAETLEPEYPHVVFDTLAYSYTRKTPKGIKPRHNVCVRLCSIECCYSHPYGQCDGMPDIFAREVTDNVHSDQSFASDLREWAKICDRLYIWDYVTNFANYCMPFPNFHVLADNIKFLTANSVRGIFEQGNSTSGGGADLNELRCYMISRLLWDPHCDIEAEKKMFLEEFYGEAASAVSEYIDLMREAVVADGVHMGIYEPPEFHHLTDAALTRAEEILSAPEEELMRDMTRLVRLKRAQLPLKFVRMRHKVKPEAIDRELIEVFFELAKTAGISRVSEIRTLEYSKNHLLEKGTLYTF